MLRLRRLAGWLGLICAGAFGASTACSSQGDDTPNERVAEQSAPVSLGGTVSSVLYDSVSFLFTGTTPVQTGVAANTISAATVAAITGRVLTQSGTVLGDVTISVVGRPEFGSTKSKTTDGTFAMAVNGGQTLRIRYSKTGYLPIDRLIPTGWQEYAPAPDVVMKQVDAVVTAVTASSGSVQVARGSAVTDTTGTRRATVIIPAGTQMTMRLPNGSTSTLTTGNMRATEYTVGTNGPNAMPADLPAAGGYTYAVELSIDEAITAAATQVTFSQLLPVYLENFLNVQVGTSIPAGYYDKAVGQWVAGTPGIVLKVLSIAGGTATVDLNNDTVADTGTALTAQGITTPELQKLAQLYAANQVLWRVRVPHFSSWDFGWNDSPPQDAPDTPCDSKTCVDASGAVVPCSIGPDTFTCKLNRTTGIYEPAGCFNGDNCSMNGLAGYGQTYTSIADDPPTLQYYCCPPGYGLTGEPSHQGNCMLTGGSGLPPACKPPPDDDDGNGPGGCDDPHASTIHGQRQSLGEDLAIAGTPFSLNYESDRQRGRQATLRIPLTGSVIIPSSTGVELEVSVGGKIFKQSFPSSPANSATTFTWDGRDVFGNVLQGSQPIDVRISDLYSGVYKNTDAFGLTGNGTAVTSGPARAAAKLRRSWRDTVQSWDAKLLGLGGWTVNVLSASFEKRRNLSRPS